ncbi:MULTISPECIES: hypothetical protein [Sphingobacterium]|uniref:Uncharacterized protein n=1 Tax=Sphingobacterium litopenaei TaxID=2763500 RepID=A0ABR7YAX8_9SPHI|nr:MULTISPECIES: hypothetical protein [Sphingobacterium]MBD1428445.1 hypothetical protein [Sphingobacterium litopenaei]NGM71751.1 hypothetical protein [Sphingobacterium sp. SGL-16]
MKNLAHRLEEIKTELKDNLGRIFWSMKNNPVYRVYLHHAIVDDKPEEFEQFVQEYYPENRNAALDELHALKEKIRKVSSDEAREIFEKNGVNLLRSDIHFMEEDAIFTMYKLDAYTNREKYIQEESVDYVDTFTDTDYILQTKKDIYLNTVEVYQEKIETIFVVDKSKQ